MPLFLTETVSLNTIAAFILASIYLSREKIKRITALLVKIYPHELKKNLEHYASLPSAMKSYKLDRGAQEGAAISQAQSKKHS